jgi:hypothetical protein
MANEGRIVCVSCGRTLVGESGQGIWPWSHSHNLPVAHFKQFECDPENFKPRCQSFNGEKGCHEKLDTPDFRAISKFDDLDQLLRYRFEHDINSFNQWLTKFTELNIRPDFEYEDYN